MKHLCGVVITVFVVITSCTLDKTDYKAALNAVTTDYIEFKEATSITHEHYKISIDALNGTFYEGYNEIHLKIINTQTKEELEAVRATFLPILTNANGNTSSCPHKFDLSYNTTDDYYLGYVVFTNESSSTLDWQLYIDFVVDGEKLSVKKKISVAQQTNENLNFTTFTGDDNAQYFIALIAPQKPSIAKNNLVAGIYKYNPSTHAAGTFPDPTQFSYAVVENHTLLIDPRMPEPSMGNHSSPNNQDLIQEDDRLYHGIVNYTMTGNWTLNFILKDDNGQIIKGTEVPTDFTPGIEGEKSELYIDVLF